MPKLHDLCQLFLEDLEALVDASPEACELWAHEAMVWLEAQGPWILEGRILARELDAVARGRGYGPRTGMDRASTPPAPVQDLINHWFAPQEAPSMERKS